MTGHTSNLRRSGRLRLFGVYVSRDTHSTIVIPLYNPSITLEEIRQSFKKYNTVLNALWT